MPTVEFGTKSAADHAREEFSDHLCPDDDRRLKEVRFTSDTPERVLEQARLDAADSFEGTSTSPMPPLGEGTREKISDLGGFDRTTTVANWRKAKGVFSREGLADQFADAIGALTDYDDPAEGAEAYIEEGKQADAKLGTKTVSGGARDEGEVDEQSRRAEAARTAKSEECDHAAGHCAHGDPEACEFISEHCDLDPDRVLARAEPERRPEEVPEGGPPDPPSGVPQGRSESPDDAGSDLSGEELGALKRSWGGYQGAVEALAEAIEQVREEWTHAQEAAKAINSIRAENGQNPLHFEALEAAQGDLADLLRVMAEDCEECHAGATGAKESLADLVGGPTPASPAATRGHRATDD